MSGETKDSLLRRLRASADLSEEDAHAIRRLPITLRRARSGEQFISTGERPSAGNWFWGLRRFECAAGLPIGAKRLHSSTT